MNYIRLMIDELTLFGIFAITFTLIIVGQGNLKLSFDTLVFFVIFFIEFRGILETWVLVRAVHRI